MASTTALVWFRRDLRLRDNPAWAAATAAADRVVPLYVLDPVALSSAGVLRRDLLLGHLAALRRDLHGLGGALLVHRGDPTTTVPRIVDEVGATKVFANADVSAYAKRRDGAITHSLSADGITVEWHWGSHVHAPGRVVSPSTGAPHHVFTPFHRSWSSTTWEEWPEPGEATIARVRGGVDLPLPQADPVMEPGEERQNAVSESGSATSTDMRTHTTCRPTPTGPPISRPICVGAPCHPATSSKWWVPPTPGGPRSPVRSVGATGMRPSSTRTRRCRPVP